MPDILQGLKWHVQFCLRVPPSAAPIVPVGNPAIHIVRLKILFFVSFLLFSHSCIQIFYEFIITATNHSNSISTWYGLERFTVTCTTNGL